MSLDSARQQEGQRRVETDHIRVNARRSDVTKQKIRVQDNGVEFREGVAHFRNGGKQEIALRRVIPAGGESRVSDLAGGNRHIKKVVMTNDAQSLRRPKRTGRGPGATMIGSEAQRDSPGKRRKERPASVS